MILSTQRLAPFLKTFVLQPRVPVPFLLRHTVTVTPQDYSPLSPSNQPKSTYNASSKQETRNWCLLSLIRCAVGPLQAVNIPFLQRAGEHVYTARPKTCVSTLPTRSTLLFQPCEQPIPSRWQKQDCNGRIVRRIPSQWGKQ
jgi:hypothetical protein